MPYTAPEILLFIAAIGAVIAQSISAWRTGKTVQETLTKTAVIEGHVNSQAARCAEQLIAKDNEIKILKNVIVEKDKAALLLAQSVVLRTRITDTVMKDKENADRSS